MKVACKTSSKRKLELRNNALGISNESNNTKVYQGRVDRPWLASDYEKEKGNAPASDYLLLRKSSAVYIHLCKKYKMR